MTHRTDRDTQGKAVPKQYSELVVSRMQDVGVALDDETLANPEQALLSDLIPAALAAGMTCVGLLFSQSPVIEATLALASSAT